MKEVSEMKKLILVLAIALIASPAFALHVYLQREGDSNVVDVNYSGADVANPPRAFALDMKIKTGNAKFFAVTNYQTQQGSCRFDEQRDTISSEKK